MKESHAHASIGSETELNHINNVTRKTWSIDVFKQEK
jgi:hypothetical protein